MTRFQPLSAEHLSQLILRHEIVESQAEAMNLASQADGSMATVANWTNDELKTFRHELIQHLVQRPLDFTKLAKAVQGNMESVGSDSQPRRERLKVILDFALQFYRTAMRSGVQSLANGPERDSAVNRYGHLASLGNDAFVAAIRRCIDAREHLDRMVSPASLIEAWAADLAVICRA